MLLPPSGLVAACTVYVAKEDFISLYLRQGVRSRDPTRRQEFLPGCALSSSSYSNADGSRLVPLTPAPFFLEAAKAVGSFQPWLCDAPGPPEISTAHLPSVAALGFVGLGVGPWFVIAALGTAEARSARSGAVLDHPVAVVGSVGLDGCLCLLQSAVRVLGRRPLWRLR